MWSLSQNIEELKALEGEIKKYSNISLSRVRQLQIKRRLMKAVHEKSPQETFGFASLIAKIRHAAQAIKPRPYFAMLLKEKLLTLNEFHGRGVFHELARLFVPRFAIIRKATVAFVIFIFATVTFFNFSFTAPRAAASFVTTFDEVKGDVMVIRGSQVMPAALGFMLEADDTVRTGVDSHAAIRFLDQSVSRLDENTDVRISKLFINPDNKTETVVELVLNRGRMWSRVINLINDLSHFQVKAQNTFAVAKKKAAFDVAVSSKGQAKFSVVQHHVSLVVASDKKVIETTLVKGFAAEVKPVASATAVIAAEKAPQKNDTWVADNLAQDKTYIETVKQEAQDQAQDQAKILPGSALYTMKEFSDTTKIALTLNESDRQKKILLAAQDKLAGAQVLWAQGDKDKANGLISEFQRDLHLVIAWVKAYDTQDNAGDATELKVQVNQLLATYQKQFSVILPGDSLYPFKEVVGEMQVVAAPSLAGQAEQKLSNAGDKLLEAHDLADQGDEAGAAQQVEAYSKAVSEVVSEVKQLPGADKEKAVSAIIDNKVEDLKALQSLGVTSLVKATVATSSEIPVLPAAIQPILPAVSTALPAVIEKVVAPIIVPVEVPTAPSAAALAATAHTELQKTVSEAKTEVLTKIGEAVFELQKDQSSVEGLKKIDDVKKIDVNGKPLVDIQVGKDTVLIKNDKKEISFPSAVLPIIPTAVQIILPKAN